MVWCLFSLPLPTFSPSANLIQSKHNPKMSDTESVSTVTAVGNVGTVTKREEAVNGGKRWKSEHVSSSV